MYGDTKIYLDGEEILLDADLFPKRYSIIDSMFAMPLEQAVRHLNSPFFLVAEIAKMRLEDSCAGQEDLDLQGLFKKYRVRLSEIDVFDKCLTPEEVQELYNCGVTTPPPVSLQKHVTRRYVLGDLF